MVVAEWRLRGRGATPLRLGLFHVRVSAEQRKKEGYPPGVRHMPSDPEEIPWPRGRLWKVGVNQSKNPMPAPPCSPWEALGSTSGISQAVFGHPGNWRLSDLLWAGTALEVGVGIGSARHATGRPTLQKSCSYPHHLYFAFPFTPALTTVYRPSVGKQSAAGSFTHEKKGF